MPPEHRRRIPGPLVAAQMQAALAGCTIGSQLIVLAKTRSTNDFVLSLARPDLREGFVAFAETQTAGRGQHGRRWESAAGKGLWFSIFLRPRITLAESPRLTSWLAVTIASVIDGHAGLRCTVKPPNDVYLDGKKVAGVLVEMHAMAEHGYCAIAGIGVNVNQRPEEFPEEIRASAGSIAMAAGAEVNRQAFAIALLQRLDRTYRATFPV